MSRLAILSRNESAPAQAVSATPGKLINLGQNVDSLGIRAYDDQIQIKIQGAHLFFAGVTFAADTENVYTLLLYRNDAPTSFIGRQTVAANHTGRILFYGLIDCEEHDVFDLRMIAPGAAYVTLRYAQFGALAL